MSEPIIYNKYQRGKIYKIVCNITGDEYFGSTTEPTVARRLATHVNNYKQWKKGNTNYCSSFQIIEKGDFNCYLVELYPCGSRDELTRREGYYQLNNECVNQLVAGRTQAEWYKVNSVIINKKHAEWCDANPDYYTNYSKQNLPVLTQKLKQWRLKNPEKVKEQRQRANQKRQSKKICSSILDDIITSIKDGESPDPISQPV